MKLTVIPNQTNPSKSHSFTITIIAVSILSGASVSVSAQNIFTPTGQQLTSGNAVSTGDYYSSSYNPAAPSYLLKGTNGLDANILGPFTGGYELGKIDSLIDELDELVDILDQDELTAEEALDAKNRFDPFLENAARDGMVKFGGALNIPLLPLMYHSNDLGTFYANLSLSGSVRSTVLDDDIDIINVNDSFKINTSAALYLKGSALTSFSVGYSRPVYKLKDGLLHAGVGVNINNYQLSKNVISLAGLEDGEDVGDAIKNDYEQNQTSTTNVGIDLGLLYASKNFTAGFTVKDINEPEYDYGEIPLDAEACNSLSGMSVDNCFVAQDAVAAGKISANEVYVANAQANISASTWIGDKVKWGLHTSVDLNEKNDAIGDQYQWANFGASVKWNNWFIPELRLGYTKNLAGTELGYYSFGVTFFKRAELDIRFSDEQVEIDDSNGPRSAYFSFAIQSKF